VNPKYFTYQNPAGILSFKFYPWGVETPVKVDSQVEKTTPLPGSLCGASFGSPGKLWPAVIEKAFGKMCIAIKYPTRFTQAGCSLTTTAPTPLYDPGYLTDDPYWGNMICIPNPGNPDICWGLTPTQWLGNAAVIMDTLTGGSNRRIETLSTIPDAYAYINNFSQSMNPMGRWKTKYPCVAWTFSDDNAAGLPPGSYSPTGIHANHNYSVLGIIDQTDIIVLRDPCGVDPTSGPVVGGFFTHYDARFKITRKWAGDLTPLAGARKNLNLLNGTGVFGIRSADFKSYFEAIGYTY
jgi:hypothetical protein